MRNECFTFKFFTAVRIAVGKMVIFFVLINEISVAIAQNTPARSDIAPLVLQRADPFIARDTTGLYYFTATVPAYDRIEIRASRTIKGIGKADPVTVWRKHDYGEMGDHIWAPELHRINEKWYIYFAAGSAENVWDIHKYALSNVSKDPTKGIWIEEGRIFSRPDKFSLDATTFELGKERYFVWVNRASEKVLNTGIFIAKLKDAKTTDDKQTLISFPQYDWEMKGFQVNEGPAVIIRSGKVFMTYSASATDANYCIGLLWADQKADLLNALSWHKLARPVLFTNEKVHRFGPGHNSFTIAEDGKTDIMVYHARSYQNIQGDPLRDPNRHTRIRVQKWDKDGMPNFNQDLSDKDTGIR